MLFKALMLIILAVAVAEVWVVVEAELAHAVAAKLCSVTSLSVVIILTEGIAATSVAED